MQVQALVDAVVEDHLRTDYSGRLVKPRLSRVRQRADVETMQWFVGEMQTLGAGKKDCLMWLSFLHTLHRREAVATVMDHLRGSGWQCTEQAATEVSTLLSERFLGPELRWG